MSSASLAKSGEPPVTAHFIPIMCVTSERYAVNNGSAKHKGRYMTRLNVTTATRHGASVRNMAHTNPTIPSNLYRAII